MNCGMRSKKGGLIPAVPSLRWMTVLLLLLPLLASGCSTVPSTPLDAPAGARIVCLVPGVIGDAGLYDGLEEALIQNGVVDLRVFDWGAPAPLFVVNFQTTEIHDAAEKDLAARLSDWRRQKPRGRIDLVGHSAGCGVILGALGRLGTGVQVDHVVLLAASVSPGYNLAPALAHVKIRLDSFHSLNDVMALEWRTGTFGTYDNYNTPAAGHGGFQSATTLPATLAGRFHQHPYNSVWSNLGNDGGHGGPVAHDFALQVVAPLLNER